MAKSPMLVLFLFLDVIMSNQHPVHTKRSMMTVMRFVSYYPEMEIPFILSETETNDTQFLDDQAVKRIRSL